MPIPFVTHQVLNQPEPLVGHNAFDGNRPLRDALAFHAPELDTTALSALGARLGTEDMQAHARWANACPPRLQTHDRFGRRVDRIEFHPSYHALLAEAVGAGLHGTPWRDGGHLARAAGFLLFNGLEPGTMCPVSMSYAASPGLHGHAVLAAAWGPRLAERQYDPRCVPGLLKPGVTMGMGMTEKQGGSDVRANTTEAVFDGDDAWGARHRLLGHKWFLSAPMSDAFLVLAQAPEGLGCFFVPRFGPDGELNALHLQRLKDKLGNRANASAEVELHGAWGWCVGEPGRGVRQILEMGALTRLDCALGTAGLMRQALALALDHAAQRRAFGRPLIAHPLMCQVLADLALESEAATALALRLARAVGQPDDPHETQVRRLLTPVAKYWICKRGAPFAQEAMECLGGNGYVEADGEGVMARIYREMPVNSIWEGAGNLMALDVARVLRRGGGAVQALESELSTAQGVQADFDRFAGALIARLHAGTAEADGRAVAQAIALAWQAALLGRHAPRVVFDAFCRLRLGPQASLAAFGGGGEGADGEAEAIVTRSMPR